MNPVVIAVGLMLVLSLLRINVVVSLALGQTVLAKACQSARIPFDNKEAHSALYDTERTTELFCHIVNRWKSLGGWPPAHPDEVADDASE